MSQTPPKPKEQKFSVYFYNGITYAGVVLAILVFLIELFLFALDFFSHRGDVYMGILTYVALPPFLILGLLLIPAGALWKRRRVRAGHGEAVPRVFRIDLTQAKHRNMVLVFLVGTFILVIMSLVGAYKAFHYTESVQFCGSVCHHVMQPEFTAYKESPHGKVKCVECHIGEGADWYVRSKLSGARQVVKSILGNYEKPIKTPVPNLRPSQETCEQCHWPGKFFSTHDFNKDYFLTDGGAEPWKIRMLLQVGGGERQSHGVHAHMNIDHDIYYAAEDERRQEISWVKSVGKDGKEVVYMTDKSKFKDSPPRPEQIRKMDCIDCHNRPTHQFRAPYRLLNDAMQYGAIDPSVPKIKEKGMELLSKEYPTQEEGMRRIREELLNYYRVSHPDYFKRNPLAVDKAADEIVDMYSKNVFPEMMTRWDTNPDNIGHLIAPGCFRCHGGEHKAAGGELITRDCKACHAIIEQGPPGQIERDIQGLEFKHPDGDESWKEMNCNDCHTGGA